MSSSWVMEQYQDAFELREQLHTLEQRYEQRIAELEKTLLERDQKIAQLRLQHQKQFKANRKLAAAEPMGKPRTRGAPRGHPPWRRRELTHVDQVIAVPPPEECPHCQGHDLEPYPEVYEHVQEDIILQPRVHVTRRVHQQCYCRTCRRVIYQVAPGQLPGCQIGPVTRAVATHLRYDLQIPYRKVQHILKNLFGMPLVPASAMTFDRKATGRGRKLYEELRVKLQCSPVVYADETSWREDGQGRYVWFGGHENLAFFQITDNRSADSALLLLGNDFGGTLVTDAYAAYNAVNASARQTCWSHIGMHCKELLQQIQLTQPPVRVPQSVRFLKQIRRLGSHLCDLGRQLRNRQLKPAAARGMIPSLHKRLKRIAGKPMDYAPAETLRQRLMEKDHDKLFTFLRIKGVQPTNNHSERSVRQHVIMRKICNGTRSPAGSESHAVLPSLLQTAQLQGKSSIEFLFTLITQPLANARAALFANTS
jgi:transposase